MIQKLLVAGAGANQIGIFRKARDLAIETIAVDGNPDAPGLHHAHASEVADILDPEELGRLARRHQVNGIYPAAELAVEAVAQAAAELGLPGLPPDVATRARNKLRMRQALDAAAIPNPSYRGVTTVEEALEAANDVGFPLIVKPADGNSSKAVQRIEGPGEVAHAFTAAFQRALCKIVLLEAYMEGDEFCVDGLVHEGEYRLGGITGKEVSPLPFRFDLGIFMPPLEDNATCSAIEECARAALEAIGFTSGTTHVEVMVTPEGPRIVEIAARPGGGRIPTDLIPLTYGMDFMADSLRIALGEAPLETRKFERGSALYWFPAEPGVVQKITGVKEAESIPGVRDVVFHAQKGDTLATIVDCVTRDRVGYVLTSGDTVREAIRAAKAARAACSVLTG